MTVVKIVNFILSERNCSTFALFAVNIKSDNVTKMAFAVVPHHLSFNTKERKSLFWLVAHLRNNKP